ncbi:hypothetical protein KXV89_004100 [Aspergillus fumigatus]|nr:hypothetical protein KXX51_003200 [Aspergillus fumigatus]KAH1561258.1 hypothetical protein KXX28_005829 [Aspergillus fumigatus]KAH1794898.1 hypothetical protein KXX36_002688 [Aspergillus fumigatus]KAH1977456.1 hypothetical protein KXW88_008467 [Aspergillus fumigatus]KAH1993707.1 hypothetical protein KXV80_006910 [Aspergillus fumigatus]
MEGMHQYLNGNPKAIFFTDFDGTVTLQDCNDYLVDNFGFGAEKRRMLELKVLNGTLAFRYVIALGRNSKIYNNSGPKNDPARDAFQAMLDSVRLPFNECLRIVQENIQLDPSFVNFYLWAKEKSIPIVILSSGMTPVIEALLVSLFAGKPSNIFIVANNVAPHNGKHINMVGGWQIKYRDDSIFGHDKSLEIKHCVALPVGERPVVAFAGDGVSDLSAASQTNILFAKEGLGK